MNHLYAQAGLPDLEHQAMALRHLGNIIYTQGNMMASRDCFFIVTAISLAAIIPAYMVRDSTG